MDARAVVDLKVFVPAKHYTLSRQFYSDLGFTALWENEQISEFQIGDYRFLLQNFYAEGCTDNFMMQLMVEDADVWWRHIDVQAMATKYPGIMAKPPALQPWGLRVLYLTDPSGVLWHIADRRSA